MLDDNFFSVIGVCYDTIDISGTGTNSDYKGISDDVVGFKYDAHSLGLDYTRDKEKALIIKLKRAHLLSALDMNTAKNLILLLGESHKI